MRYVYLWIIPLFFNFINSKLDAQEFPDKIFYPIDSILHKLEEKNQVRFFYDPIWFENKTFSNQLSNMPIENAVSVICKITDLKISNLSPHYYIFSKNQVGLTYTNTDEFIRIGDKMTYGSKKNAIIRGIIKSAGTDYPLPGVTISCSTSNSTYISKDKGIFQMELPVGENILTFEYPGYDPTQLKLMAYGDGSVNIEMNPKSILLDEVSVVATRMDQFYRRAKMSIMSMDAKSLKELPTNVGEVDIIKGLTLMPGVQSVGEFGSGFNVRGGNSDQNLILIEEVPIFNSAHLFGLITSINPDIIEKTTLYKGAIPVIYGERASSILSINIGKNENTKAQITGGIGLFNCHLNLNIPINKKLRLNMGGRTSYSNWLLQSLQDIELRNSAARFNDYNVQLTFNPNHKNELSAFAYISNDHFNLVGTTKYFYSNKLLSLNYDHNFNANSHLSFIIGRSNYNAYHIQNDTLLKSESYKYSDNIYYNNIKANYTLNWNTKHILNLGGTVILYQINPGNIEPYGSFSVINKQETFEDKGIEWALFIGDDYEINPKLDIEYGLRYSNFWSIGAKEVYLYQSGNVKSIKNIIDTIGNSNWNISKKYKGLEPRFSLKYVLNNQSSLRTSYTRINQYINLISNSTISSPTDYWKLANNYIKPVICDQFAIGYYRSLKNNLFEASLEIYYKKYTNLFDYKNGASIQLNNHLETELIPVKGKSMGIEFYLKKDHGKVKGWLSYTFSKSLRKTTSNYETEQLNKNQWFPDNLDKPHNFVLNSSYNINKRWKLSFNFSYNTGRPITLPELKYTIKGNQLVYYSDRNKYRIPDYHRLDISISQFESLRIHKKWKGYWTFSILNIYGRKNAYAVFYKKDHSVYNNFQGSSLLYKMYLIGRPLPTISYSFMF